MFAPAARRLLCAGLILALASLACATTDVPIDPNATAPGAANAATLPPAASDTPAAAEAEPSESASSPTPPNTHTPAPSATSGGLVQVAIPGGTFDAGLGDWLVSDTAYVNWRDGYARLNASEAPGGAALARDLEVPAASRVTLHFIFRSENVADGDCAIEPRPGDVRFFSADNQWRDAEVDFTAEAGTVFQVGVSTHIGGACDWIQFDEFYWLVPAGEAPPTPQATLRAPTPTLEAIPPAYVFTQTFTVSAEGDFPAGLPNTLNDGQPSTWASLRGGTGYWQFDLGQPRTVAGFRLLAIRDGDEDTTLLGVDISFDGHSWITVYTPASQCGETPNCLILEQGEPVDLPLGPLDTRHIRLQGGPTNFALAEVEIAILP
jgi:hypothetical protein